MKTTTKKPSPLKFFTPIAAGMDSVKKATDAVSAAYKAKKDAKAKAATTKTPEGKPNASVKPTGKKAIDTVKKVATSATKGSVKSALMQLKKHKR